MVTYHSLDPATITEQDVVEINLLMPQLTTSGKIVTIDCLLTIVAGAEVVVAFDHKGTIKGMATLAILQKPTGTIGFIEDVVVDLSMRGHNVAIGLLTCLLKYAKEHSIHRIELTSNPQRTEANRLYTKLGFVLRETNHYWKSI